MFHVHALLGFLNTSREDGSLNPRQLLRSIVGNTPKWVGLFASHGLSTRVFFQVEKRGMKNHLLLARDVMENRQGADNLLNIREEVELVMNAPFSFKPFSCPYLEVLLWIYSAS